MKKNKIIITNRSTQYRYFIYRDTDISNLINLTDRAPDIVIEKECLENYFIDGIISAGIIQNIPIAHGLAAPKPSYMINNTQISIKVDDNPGIIYYYKIVAVDDANKPVSSYVMLSSCLKQPFENIIHIIRNKNNVVIKTFENQAILNLSDLINVDVPIFSIDEITINRYYIDLNNEVIINIPNIWYDIDKSYNYRIYQPMNLYATCQGEESLPTPVEYLDAKAYIPIDKIEITRKEVDVFDNTPILETDINSTTMNVLVREYGIYYKPEYSNIPRNMINRYGVVSVFNNLSHIDKLAIINRCSVGKNYKYMIKTYDCFGKASEPIIFNITT